MDGSDHRTLCRGTAFAAASGVRALITSMIPWSASLATSNSTRSAEKTPTTIHDFAHIDPIPLTDAWSLQYWLGSPCLRSLSDALLRSPGSRGRRDPECYRPSNICLTRLLCPLVRTTRHRRAKDSLKHRLSQNADLTHSLQRSFGAQRSC